MNIRVLHITGTSIVGGAENNLLRMLKRERSLGVEPVAVLLPSDGPLVSKLTSINLTIGLIDYYGFRLPNPLRYFQTLRQLLYWVRKTKPHIIHLNLQPFAEFAYRLKQITGLPTVCDVRGIHSGPYASDFIPGYQRWLPALDRIIVPSQAVKEDLHKWGVDISNVIVIHDGIEFQNDSYDNTTNEGLRCELGINSSTPLFGYIGRITREKGLEDLIRAAYLVKENGVDAKWVFVGTDGQNGRLMKCFMDLAVELKMADRISFLGFRDDIWNVLKNLDLFVMPSWSEAFPNSVLEAMDAGVLTVATDVGGVSEMIVDGKGGILVNAKDPESLAQGILEAWHMDPEKKGEILDFAKKMIREKFDLNIQVSKLRDLYGILTQ